MSKAKKNATELATAKPRSPEAAATSAGNGAASEDRSAFVLDGDGTVDTRAHVEPDDFAGENRELVTAKPAPIIELPISPRVADGLEANEAVVRPTDQVAQDEWPIDRSKVDIVRERRAMFVVFIDQQHRVRWLAAFPPSELSEEAQAVIVRARLLAATPTTYLDAGQQTAWMRMIGESLALALSGDVENSRRTLSMAETFVASRAREIARLWYLKASLAAFFAIAVWGGVIAFILPLLQDSALFEYVKPIGVAVLFGVVGSQFSVLLRASTLNVDPGAGCSAHYVEAVVRILLGAFAAVIAVVAIHAKIVLGFVMNSDGSDSMWLIPMVAMLAGASERFVPGILRNVETSTLEKDSKVEGGHLTNGQASASETQNAASPP